MIRITVTGKSYPVRKMMYENKFKWNKGSTSWSKTVGEGSLDTTIKNIIPDNPTVTLRFKLQKVDLNGNAFSPKIQFNLRDMDRPGVNVLELFNERLSGSSVSPTLASGPINPKKDKEKKWKKLPGVDGGFF